MFHFKLRRCIGFFIEYISGVNDPHEWKTEMLCMHKYRDTMNNSNYDGSYMLCCCGSWTYKILGCLGFVSQIVQNYLPCSQNFFNFMCCNKVIPCFSDDALGKKSYIQVNTIIWSLHSKHCLSKCQTYLYILLCVCKQNS